MGALIVVAAVIVALWGVGRFNYWDRPENVGRYQARSDWPHT